MLVLVFTNYAFAFELCDAFASGAAYSGWFRSKAGDSLLILGMEVKLWRGNGEAVAHSSDLP